MKHPDRVPATYTRTQGVRHLLAAYDLENDKLFGIIKKHKRWIEFLHLLKIIRRLYPQRLYRRLLIVLDNCSSHKKDEVKSWCRENGVWLIFTATNASWMNRIECHFGPVREFVLNNSNYKNHRELAQAFKEHLRWRNLHPSDLRILKAQNKIYVI